MSQLTIEKNISKRYFSFLSKLDMDSKKQLIEMLKESIAKEEREFSDINSLFGAWDDERDSYTIIKDTKNL